MATRPLGPRQLAVFLYLLSHERGTEMAIDSWFVAACPRLSQGGISGILSSLVCRGIVRRLRCDLNGHANYELTQSGIELAAILNAQTERTGA
jgi:DNA-binding MarR family transcriptional regulator